MSTRQTLVPPRNDPHYRRRRLSRAALRGADVPSLRSFDPEGDTVILTETFSKSFSPGFRVGWGFCRAIWSSPSRIKKGNRLRFAPLHPARHGRRDRGGPVAAARRKAARISGEARRPRWPPATNSSARSQASTVAFRRAAFTSGCACPMTSKPAPAGRSSMRLSKKACCTCRASISTSTRAATGGPQHHAGQLRRAVA